jgi:hypothetical protein
VLYGLLADLTVTLHFAFVIFVVAGGLLVIRWPRVAWVHVPAAVWGAVIELAGWICPLTPLEQWLRLQSGSRGYSGDFVDRYVMPLLYPDWLSRPTQFALAAFVVVANLAIYFWVWRATSGGRRGGRA